MWRHRGTWAVAAAAALTLAACGTDDDDASEAAAATPAAVEADAEEMSDDMESMSDEMTDDMESMSDEMMSDDMESMSDETDDMESMSDETDDMESMSDEMMGEPTTFVVTLENVSEVTPFAPGIALAGHGQTPLFTRGAPDFGEGLEAVAEDGDPTELAASYPEAVVFNTPVDADGPGPLLPGASYTFEIDAVPGDRLHFVTMVVQTNDWFVAGGAEGIELFPDDEPVSGDVTDALRTYDSGTELDQPFSEGADQAPRQAGPDTGDVDPDDTVRSVDLDAGEHLRVTITPAA